MAALATVTDLRQKFDGPDRLSELFHMVNRILPEDQSVRSVPPDTTAKNAENNSGRNPLYTILIPARVR